jgi:hypothetical protein
MRRITYKEQETVKQFQLTAVQHAIYNSLLAFQLEFPQLTTAQYEMWKSLFKQIKRNKPALNYHG